MERGRKGAEREGEKGRERQGKRNDTEKWGEIEGGLEGGDG